MGNLEKENLRFAECITTGYAEEVSSARMESEQANFSCKLRSSFKLLLLFFRAENRVVVESPLSNGSRLH